MIHFDNFSANFFYDKYAGLKNDMLCETYLSNSPAISLKAFRLYSLILLLWYFLEGSSKVPRIRY